jgi:hypothetical protein
VIENRTNVHEVILFSSEDLVLATDVQAVYSAWEVISEHTDIYGAALYFCKEGKQA